MTRGTNWTLPGSIYVEVRQVDGKVVDYSDPPREFPAELLKHVKPNDDVSYELFVEFTSRGYHTPASMYGGPDHLGWPEEGEDERTMDCVGLQIQGPDVEQYQLVTVSKDVQQRIFELVLDDVMAAELDER